MNLFIFNPIMTNTNTLLKKLVIFVLLISSLTSSSPPPIADVISSRLQWEKNCLVPASGGGGKDQENDQGQTRQEEDPRQQVAGKCALYYLHNHKTGGSTMCKTAHVNGLKVPSLKTNCNVPLAIRTNKIIHLQEYVAENKIQFVAQEDEPFRMNESNTHFVYMTTIRNPMDRMVSHLHHEFCGMGPLNVERELRSHGCLRPPGTLSDLISDPCFDRQRMSHITTDYYLAMLTGCANRMSRDDHFEPPGTDTCSEVHLEEAKRMLNYFSVILISDNSVEMDR
jgi:hypothetical protein